MQDFITSGLREDIYLHRAVKLKLLESTDIIKWNIEQDIHRPIIVKIDLSKYYRK